MNSSRQASLTEVPQFIETLDPGAELTFTELMQKEKREKWRLAKAKSRDRQKERTTPSLVTLPVNLPMTPPMTKYDLRSSGHVEESPVNGRIQRGHPAQPTIQRGRGRRRRQPIQGAEPYPTHRRQNTQALSRSNDVQSLPSVDPFDPRRDAQPFPRVELHMNDDEPRPGLELRHSMTDTLQPIANPYIIPRIDQPAATPPQATHLVNSSAFDQAVAAPCEGTSDWLNSSTSANDDIDLNIPSEDFLQELMNFAWPSPPLDGENTLSSDSAITASTRPALTNISSSLADPKDNFPRPVFPAIQILEKVQELKAQARSHEQELQEREYQYKIKLIEDELNE